MKQLFEEEVKEKPNYLTTLECQSCHQSFEGNFWQKRCPVCKKEDKPYTKQLNKKAKFTGRLYKSPTTGKEYPSVTSILHPEGLDYPEYLLKQYGSRGTIVHELIEIYCKTGEWKDPRDIDYLQEHIKKVEEGSLKLQWSDCDFIGFMKEYGEGMEFKTFEGTIINDEYEFGGRYDALGLHQKEDTIFDWKTSSTYDDEKLDNYFMQLSAYAKTLKNIKKLIIVPLNPKRGYQEPFVSTNIDKHFEDFLKKRDEFRKIYEI